MVFWCNKVSLSPKVLHAGLTLTTLNPAYTPHELAHQVLPGNTTTKNYCNKLQKLEDALIEQMLTAADLADRGDRGDQGDHGDWSDRRNGRIC